MVGMIGIAIGLTALGMFASAVIAAVMARPAPTNLPRARVVRG